MGKVESFFKYCFLVFAIIIVLIKCLYLYNIIPFIMATVGTVGIIGLVFLATKHWQKSYNAITSKLLWIDNISYRKMIVIIATISIVTKVLAIFIFHIESLNDGSDIDVYVGSAYELGTTGTVISHPGYLLSYSHMFWFSVFLSPIARVFGVSQTAFSLFLTSILTVSTVLLFAAFSEQIGKNKSFIIFLIYSSLPGTVLLPQYITHEIALLFFESIAIWLYFRCLPKCKNYVEKALIYLIFAISLLFAFLVNTAGLVMIIAFGILFFVQLISKFNFTQIRLFAEKLLVLIVIVSAGNTVATDVQNNYCLVPDSFIPSDKVLWTLYVGGSVANNGGWNIDDSNEFDSYNQDLNYDEIQEFRRNKVKERYQELLSHPLDLGRLIKQKLITVWGVFGYSILYTNENIPNPRLQIFYNKYLDRPLLLLEYTASVFASIVCLVEVINHRNKVPYFVLLIQLYLMGTTAMLMITECRNKYVIAMQPFFWMACFAFCQRKETVSQILKQTQTTDTPCE